jgi:hypothetical protein
MMAFDLGEVTEQRQEIGLRRVAVIPIDRLRALPVFQNRARKRFYF